MYDWLIVGAGLFGSVFAYEASKRGLKCLVIDKREHIGGGAYTEEIEGIQIHKYGPHIFHTNDRNIWEYVSKFAEFNRFTNSPIANYKGKLYNLPFNMNTFYSLWGIYKPDDVKEKIKSQRRNITEPKNLEEQAISLVGTEIYEILIKEYTEKQWGRKPVDLPADIIRRLPVRLTFDNNYFNDRYQGIPIGGYTQIIEKMLDKCDVRLNADYIEERNKYSDIAAKTLFTGMIDEYYDYKHGYLEYRSLRFETEILDTDNYQGNAVVNYTSLEVPCTRIIEHKHFDFGTQEKTVITKEYSAEWKPGSDPYYPISNEKNIQAYNEYKKLAEKEKNTYFGGRLGTYQYLDMHVVIDLALKMVSELLN